VIATLWPKDFFPDYGESEAGDKVLARLEELQKADNIKLKYREVTSVDQFINEYQAAMASGSYYADIVESQLWYARNWIRSGYAVDLGSLPSFGINQDKYLKLYGKLCEYDGKTYGTNFTSWYNRFPLVNYGIMMVNLSLLARKNQPDVYKLIDQGKWTWQAFRSICNAVKETQNGRTTLWGCANDIAANALWSTGKRFITFDKSQKKWVFGFANTSSYNAMQLAIDMYNTDKTVNYSSDQNYGFRELFCKGKAAFVNVETEWLFFGETNHSWISDLKDDFGFIPFPLSNDNASGKYAGAFGGNSRIFFIPSTTKKPDDVALVFNQLTEPLAGTAAGDWKKNMTENVLRGNGNSFKWYWELLSNGEYDMMSDLGTLQSQPFWLTLRSAVVEKSKTPAEVVGIEQEPANRYLNQTVNNDPKMLKPFY